VDLLFLILDRDVWLLVVNVKMNLVFTRNLLIAWATISATVIFLLYLLYLFNLFNLFTVQNVNKSTLNLCLNTVLRNHYNIVYYFDTEEFRRTIYKYRFSTKSNRQSASQPADKGNGPIPIIHATRFPAFRPISLPLSLHLQNVRFVSVCFAPPKATDGTTIFPSPENYIVTIHPTP
jgi:hypothetical protein